MGKVCKSSCTQINSKWNEGIVKGFFESVLECFENGYKTAIDRHHVRIKRHKECIDVFGKPFVMDKKEFDAKLEFLNEHLTTFEKPTKYVDKFKVYFGRNDVILEIIDKLKKMEVKWIGGSIGRDWESLKKHKRALTLIAKSKRYEYTFNITPSSKSSGIKLVCAEKRKKIKKITEEDVKKINEKGITKIKGIEKIRTKMRIKK